VRGSFTITVFRTPHVHAAHSQGVSLLTFTQALPPQLKKGALPPSEHSPS